jgi:hypothetical protein
MIIKPELLNVLTDLGLAEEQIIDLARRLQSNADQHQQAVTYYETQIAQNQRMKAEAEVKRDAALDMIAKISVQ